jgi:hypothetical protein
MKTSFKSLTNIQTWRLAAITIGSALGLTLANTTFAMGSGNPPNINSGNETGTVNVAFSYQIAANNSPTSYNATNRPPGLNINTTTGLISGTPTQVGVYTVHLSATNAFGTGTKDVTFTINSGPSAIAAISPAAVYTGDIVTLDASASHTNPPGGTLTYVWQQIAPASPTISLAPNNKAVIATFAAPAPPVGADSQAVTFNVKVTDDSVSGGAKNTTSDPVTTTVYKLPTANAGADAHVSEGTLFTLHGNGTGMNLTYTWMVPAGITDFSDIHAQNLTFTSPPVSHNGAPYTFTLVVTEHRGGGLPDKDSAPDQVTINVDDLNSVPTAYPSAVNDPNNIQQEGTVDESTEVTIYGFGTDPDLYDNPITQFTWTQTGGPIVTLSNSNSQAPTFTAPAVANGLQQIDLVFCLSVSDGFVNSGPSYVTIHVLNTNDPPIPGLTVNGSSNDPVQVGENTLVTLDGSTSTDPNNTISDPNHDTLTYKWEQVGGTPVVLNPDPASGFSSSPMATFTAPGVSTTLTLRLTVSDGDFEVSQEVNVAVVETNHPPTADAGLDQTVPEAATAFLDGSAFDPDSDMPLTFQWTQTFGPMVTLTSESPDNHKMSFVAPAFGGSGGMLKFQLKVTDTHAASGTDEVVVNVYPNRPPIPNAGVDQSKTEGDPVGLSGSATDPDKDSNLLTYSWSQVGGPPIDPLTFVVDPNDSRQATFIAPPVTCGGGVVTMRLTVNDGYVDVFDDVTINIANFNHDPTANGGGNQNPPENTLVSLNGSGNDQDTEEAPFLAYQWNQTSGPTVTLNGSDQNVSFTAPEIPGGDPTAKVVYGFLLTVRDQCGGSATDPVTVTVENVAHAPIAVAQGPATVNENTSGVMLSGTGSSDPDGDTLTYAWTQCVGPHVTLNGADSATPSFDAPWVSGGTQLKFKLTVSDGFGGTNSAFVTVTVLNINDPPTLLNPRADVPVLWPPDHRMVAVHILGVMDAQNNATITIDSVTQDEPTNGLGDGDTAIDAIKDGDTVLLRAERSGTGNGRVYHICFTAADPEGSVSGCVNVMVPKSKKTDVAIDSGGHYDSTH